MALSGFAPATYTFLAPTMGELVTEAITGSPVNAVITNASSGNIGFVAFGTTVTSATGVLVLPGTTIVLTVASATHISGIGDGSLLYISFGD
jgi:hypothetical protein